MSDLQFTVSADTSKASKDLQKLSQSVDQIQRTTAEASLGFQQLAKTIATAAAAFGTLSIAAKLSDAVTTLDNKIKLVTQSTRELIQVQQLLVDTSIKTRSTIGSTLNVYSAFAKSVDRTKVSLQQLNQATDVVQKTIAISGSSVESSNAALIQLSQGLQAGQLRGEELNSVMEQTPRLAQAIADGLGTTLGSLRKIAEEGQLTADVVFGALISQSQKVGAEFNKTAVTINSAFNQLGDSISFVLGNVVNTLGVGGMFSSVIVKMANTLKESFSEVESYTVVFSSSIFRAFSNLKLFVGAFEPVFDAIGARLLEIMPVLNIMKLSFASIFSLAIFDSALTSISYLRSGLESIVKSSDTLRGIFGEFEVIGLVLPEIGMRIRDAFASKTLEEFQANMKRVAEAVRNGARPIETILRDTFLPREVFTLFYGVRDVLVQFGFLERKLISIGNIRLDVLGNAWYNIRAAFAEIADYDLESKFSSVRNSLRVTIYGMGLYIEQIGMLFDNVFGRAIASFGKVIAQISGAPRSLTLFGLFLEHQLQLFSEIFVSDKIFDGLRSIFKGITHYIDKLQSAYVLFMKTTAAFSNVSIIAGFVKEGIYSILGKPLVQSIKELGANLKEAITMIFDTLVSSVNLKKVGQYLKQLVLDIYNNFSLDRVLKMVKDFAWSVMHFFFMIYDAVVGHSYWPDMVEGVVDWTKKLITDTKNLLTKFRDNVDSAFRFKAKDSDIVEYLKEVKRRLSAFSKNFEISNPFKGKEETLSKFLPTQIAEKIADATVEGIQKAMQIIAVVAITAIASAFVPAVRTALLTILGVQLASNLSKGIEFAFGSIMDSSLFGKLGESIGTTVGTYVKIALNSLPETVQLALNAFEGFGKGIAEEFGIIGTLAKGIANIFSGGEGNLVLGLFGGAAGIALLTNGREIIKSIFTALLGTTKLKDKSVFDTFFQSILGTENRGLILGGVAALLSAFSDQVNIVQAALMATPLLLTAIIGKDVAGKLIIDLAKIAIAKVTTTIAAYMATKTVGASFLDKLFGVDNSSKIKSTAQSVADKVKSGIDIVSRLSDAERKKQYLAGEMNLKDYLSGANPTTAKSTPNGLSSMGFIIPENVGSGPRKAASKVADEVKSTFEAKKNQLSVLPYIVGGQGSDFGDIRSFGEKLTDYFNTLGNKWEALGVKRRQFFKLAATGAIIGLAVAADDANAATTSTFENISTSISSVKDSILNNIEAISLGIVVLLGVFKKTGGFEKALDLIGLTKLFSSLKERVLSVVSFVGRLLARLTPIGIAATVGGLLAVALFGEGNSIEEKFQNAYMWVAKIFNFREANQGRKGKVSALVKEGIGLREDSNLLAGNVQSRIGSLDFSKLTSKSYKEIEALSTEFGKLTSQANRELKIDGEVSLVTSDSLDKLIKQLDRALTRAETKARDISVPDKYKGLLEGLNQKDKSYSEIFMNRIAPDGLYGSGAAAFNPKNLAWIPDMLSKALAPSISSLSGYSSKLLPTGLNTESLSQDLAVVNTDFRDGFIDALNSFETKYKEFREKELDNAVAESDKRFGAFWIRVNPAEVAKARVEMEKALDALTSKYADLKLLAETARKLDAFEKGKKLLTDSFSRAGITVNKGDLDLISGLSGAGYGAKGRLGGLDGIVYDTVYERMSRELNSLESQRLIVASPEVKRDIELAYRKKVKEFTNWFQEESSKSFVKERVEFAGTKSGFNLSENDQRLAGRSLFTNLLPKMDEVNALKNTLSTIEFGKPGALERYVEQLDKIKIKSKEIQDQLDQLKPPSEREALQAGRVGLSVSKENLSRYSEPFRASVNTATSTLEDIQNKIDMNTRIRGSILARFGPDANKDIAKTATAGIDESNRKLERQAAILVATTTKATGLADEYLQIRDTIESFEFKVGKSGLSIPKELYALSSGEDRKILDDTISKAKEIMDSARGKGGINALRGLPPLLDRVSTVQERLQRTTSQVISSALGSMSADSFTKLKENQQEIIKNGIEILNLESQLAKMKGQENTEGFISVKVKLDQAVAKRTLMTDTRSVFSRFSDTMPKLNLATGIDENQFKMLPETMQKQISSLSLNVSKLITDNPSWDASDALGNLLDPTANSKVKDAISSAKQGIDKLLIGLFAQDVDIDAFAWLSSSTEEKGKVLSLVQEILKIEQDLAEIRKGPLSKERLEKESEKRRLLEQKKLEKVDVLPASLGEKIKIAGINMSDLFFQYSQDSFEAEYARKKELARLDLELSRVTDLGAESTKKLINERVKLTTEEKRASEVRSRREQLASSLKGSLSTYVGAKLSGQADATDTLVNSVTGTIVDTVSQQFTNIAFGGITTMFGDLFGDVFGTGIKADGSSREKALWVRTDELGSSGTTGGMMGGLFDKGLGFLKNGWDTLTNGLGGVFGETSLSALDYASLSGFAEGGVIPGHGTGAVPIVAHAGEIILNEAQQARVSAAISSGNQVVNHISITGDISRQTKSEIMQMLPQIAGGVNAYNRENNIRR